VTGLEILGQVALGQTLSRRDEDACDRLDAYVLSAFDSADAFSDAFAYGPRANTSTERSTRTSTSSRTTKSTTRRGPTVRSAET
jgi:hypothetical protein